MELIVASGVTFVLLILSVYRGMFLAYPLMVAVVLFSIVAIRKGYKLKEIYQMGYRGGKKSLVVIKIFILIGAIVPIWMASGTVPAIVYYGINLIIPNLFILFAFLISCFVSLMIGTSMGTCGVVGIAFMVMAKSGGVNLAATAGAVIAGAYFGDRCSPMSSSASFVAFLTDTNIYDNIRNMFKSGIIPFMLSVVFYALVSYVFPMNISTNTINNEILRAFNLNVVVFIPAIIIIMFSLFKVKVKISMSVSIIAALLISIFVQGESLSDYLRYMIYGFSLDKSDPLYTIIKGGGIISMLRTSLIVFLASIIAGIVEETEMLNKIEDITQRADSRYGIFRNVFITSIFTAAVGCSQTFAVMLTHLLNKKAYEKNNLDNLSLAMDLENTAILIAALIPWNAALLTPMTILGSDISCIPYLAYIYILPVSNLLYLRFRNGRRVLTVQK